MKMKIVILLAAALVAAFAPSARAAIKVKPASAVAPSGTEVRVFHLESAHLMDAATLLVSVFPDNSRSGNRPGGAASGRVIAAVDKRASCLVVSASKENMERVATLLRLVQKRQQEENQ